MAVTGTCKHGAEIGAGQQPCPQCAAEKKRANSVKTRQKRVAQRRECPSCHRKAALQPVKIAGAVVKLKCRWCGREVARKKITKR